MSGSTSQGTASGPDREAEILSLSAAWVQAELRGDFAAVSDILADDYESVTSTGAIMPKAQWLALLPSIQFEQLILDDVKIRSFDNTAILSGVLTTKVQREGKIIAGRFRSVDIFLCRGGRWRAVSSQLTRLES